MRISDWSSDVCSSDLWHARSALVAILTLPLGILIAFIVMRFQGLNANILSLGEHRGEHDAVAVGDLPGRERASGLDEFVAGGDDRDARAAADGELRSEWRRGGKGCVSTCRSGGPPYPKK